MKRVARSFVFSSASLVLTTTSLAATPQYTFTDLGLGVTPHDINNLGQVVGSSPNGPFLRSGGTTTVFNSYAQFGAINDAGDIVGYARSGVLSSDPTTAFLYRDGQFLDLGLGPNSSAVDINNAGQIAANRAGGAVILSGDQVIPLSSLAVGISSLNNLGQVAGWSGPPSSPHATLFSADGSAQDLGTLPFDLDAKSFAYAINDLGQAVGYSEGTQGSIFFDHYAHATLFFNGSVIDIHRLGPDPTFWAKQSEAYGINNAGTAVGRAIATFIGNREEHAALFTSNRDMVDLNTLVPQDIGITLVNATAINDLGQIIGTARHGYYDMDPPHGFLLTPIGLPEPSLLLPLAAAPVLLPRRPRAACR